MMLLMWIMAMVAVLYMLFGLAKFVVLVKRGDIDAPFRLVFLALTLSLLFWPAFDGLVVKYDE